MTKFEIDIDLPDDVAASYRPVAYRRVRKGDRYIDDCFAEIRDHQRSEITKHRCIILAPIATWLEWPEWLTAAAVARDQSSVWIVGEKDFDREDCYWSSAGAVWPLSCLSTFTNLTLPTYDGPWEHSLIRNPHLMKEGE